MKTLVNRLVNFDDYLFLQIFNWHGIKIIDQFFKMVSRTGDGYFYLLLAPILWILEPVESSEIIRYLLLTFTIELGLYKIIKSQVKRDRPFVKIKIVHYLVDPPDQFSFPSGHTAAAFVIVVILGSYYPPLQFPLILWGMTVGLSRVYLGVHFPTDIMAGAVLGTLSARLIMMFF